MHESVTLNVSRWDSFNVDAVAGLVECQIEELQQVVDITVPIGDSKNIKDNNFFK